MKRERRKHRQVKDLVHEPAVAKLCTLAPLLILLVGGLL